jgi:predicted GNAT family N-acyltransferase
MTVECVALGSWAQLGDEARGVRLAVFVQEQGIDPQLELDAADAGALHVVRRDGAGRAVATGRLLPDGRIGRMAVLADVRGQGHGRVVLQVLMQAARARGYAQVHLHAQESAQGFYAQAGFVAVGAVYFEAGIRHVTMEYRFTT